MRFATVAILSVAAIAAAQSTDEYKCDAQNIVDTCVAQYDAQIDSCDGNDWICLCDTHTNKLTCYNNCPNSPEKPPVENQVIQYCQAAEPLKSASSASRAAHEATATAKPSDASTTDTGESVATTGLAEGSSTASATVAENTGAAGALVVPVGGAIAAGLLAFL